MKCAFSFGASYHRECSLLNDITRSLHSAVDQVDHGQMLKDERSGRAGLGIIGLDEQHGVAIYVLADGTGSKSGNWLSAKSPQTDIRLGRWQPIEQIDKIRK